MTSNTRRSVLFVGACYYNTWYLSRELRKIGWRADVLISSHEGTEQFAHGFDFRLDYNNWDYSCPTGKVERLTKELGQIHRRLKDQAIKTIERSAAIELSDMMREMLSVAAGPQKEQLAPLFNAIDGRYDILHYTGSQSIRFFHFFNPAVFGHAPIGWDVELLKFLGRKIVYTNNGCLDGVSQSSFRAWDNGTTCNICAWKNNPEVCSDEKNLAWGKLRNSVADFQITTGGNRADYNDDPRVHEVPQFYCLDPEVWSLDLDIPAEHRLSIPNDTIKIYHAVGNYDARSNANGVNIKCSHIYFPLVEQLKTEGYDVELVFFKDVPNKILRYYQAQCDIFVDMLTFGWFGANIREGMMLGKPCVCYIRPEWLDTMKTEIPDYVSELPVISANPDTIHDILVDLITNIDMRKTCGSKSRDFAMKWHAADSAALLIQTIYENLF